MFAKICIAALSLAAAVAEPPVNHGYLPPVTGPPGYNYPTPNQPLRPPNQPQYQPPPPPPPPQRPSYGPPVTNRPPPPPPSYGPPVTNRPPPPPPSYGPPVTNRPPPPRPPPTYTPGPTYGPPAPPPPPRPSYGPPTGGSDYKPNQIPGGRPFVPGGNIQNDIPTGPSGGGEHDHHHHHEPGMPFDFNYAVKDDYYGTDYSHNAVSDGDVVRGEYKVLLPDGRLQIVTYTADWKNGFNADIKYQGEPTYPAPGQTGQNRPGSGTGPSGDYRSPSGSGPY